VLSSLTLGIAIDATSGTAQLVWSPRRLASSCMMRESSGASCTVFTRLPDPAAENRGSMVCMPQSLGRLGQREPGARDPEPARAIRRGRRLPGDLQGRDGRSDSGPDRGALKQRILKLSGLDAVADRMHLDRVAAALGDHICKLEVWLSGLDNHDRIGGQPR
jgi:hypothetical protein